MRNNTLFRAIIFFLVMLIFFGTALGRLQESQQAQGQILLEDAVRKSAVACYASEGFYPPSVAYLQEHYGLQWNSKKYIIHYEIFASNLMPEITIISK